MNSTKGDIWEVSIVRNSFCPSAHQFQNKETLFAAEARQRSSFQIGALGDIQWSGCRSVAATYVQHRRSDCFPNWLDAQLVRCTDKLFRPDISKDHQEYKRWNSELRWAIRPSRTVEASGRRPVQSLHTTIQVIFRRKFQLFIMHRFINNRSFSSCCVRTQS